MHALPARLVVGSALALASLCAAAQPYTIDKGSPFYRQLLASPVPTEVQELLFVSDVMNMAGEGHASWRFRQIAERKVLRAMLERPDELAAATIADLTAPAAALDLEALRREARMKSLTVVKDAPLPSPSHRAIRNFTALTVTAFQVEVAVPSSPEDLSCKWEGTLAPREVAVVACTPTKATALRDMGPYAVAEVRVAPGSYVIRGRSGDFASTEAASRARLAALPPQELQRPRVARTPEALEALESEGQATLTLASLALLAIGFALGLPIGARHPRPGRATGTVAVVTGVLLAVAAVALTLSGSGLEPGLHDKTGGVMTAIGIFLAIGLALATAAVWLAVNAGVWLGVWAGRLWRRA